MKASTKYVVTQAYSIKNVSVSIQHTDSIDNTEYSPFWGRAGIPHHSRKQLKTKQRRSNNRHEPENPRPGAPPVPEQADAHERREVHQAELRHLPPARRHLPRKDAVANKPYRPQADQAANPQPKKCQADCARAGAVAAAEDIREHREEQAEVAVVERREDEQREHDQRQEQQLHGEDDAAGEQRAAAARYPAASAAAGWPSRRVRLGHDERARGCTRAADDGKQPEGPGPAAGLTEVAAGSGAEQLVHGQERHGRAAPLLLDGVGNGAGGGCQRRGPRAAHDEAEADEDVQVRAGGAGDGEGDEEDVVGEIEA